MSRPDPQHSFRNLQPGLLISPGTLVVANVTKALPSSEEHKPAGSLAVIEASPSNRELNLVRFADGASLDHGPSP